MNYKKLIIDSGIRMLQGGFTVETWGNISARDPQTGLVYITPSGMDYETCKEDDVIVYNLNGEVVEGHRKSTIETKLHLDIYRNRPEINAVVHTHPIYSLVFACLKKDIPLIIDEAAQCLGDTIKVADYALPGTPELADNCIKALGKQANACMLQSHGSVCIGESMEGAFKVAKVLELTAQIYQMILTMGQEPVLLSDENIKIMQDFAKYKYGQKDL